MSFWFCHLDFTSPPLCPDRITSVPLDDDIKGRILTKFETNLFVYNKLIKV